SFVLVPFMGRNFFPSVDTGEISMHVRAPVGTRIEETAALFDHIETRIRQMVPPDELGSIVDNIGLPVRVTGTAFIKLGPIGPENCRILVSLNEGHAATADYVKKLRVAL